MQNIPAIALTKGGAVPLISLSEAIGRSLNNVGMGLGWDPAHGASIDLDASCVMFKSDRSFHSAVYFADRRSADGAVNHSGDNLTGAGDGDDEMIAVHLDLVAEDIHYLVFIVNSFRGHTFDKVKSAYCRLIDDAKGHPAEAARFTITDSGRKTGMIMACLARQNGGWTMHAIGELVEGRTYRDNVSDIQSCLMGLKPSDSAPSVSLSDMKTDNAPQKKPGLFGRLFGS